MILKIALLFFLATLSSPTNAQNIGIFETGSDIGNPKLSGSSAYDASTKTYTLKGSGYNIWFQRDEFHFLYRKIKGDFILTANFEFAGKGTDPHRKVGWMIRESTNDSASHISAVVHGDGLNVLQWRVRQGAMMRDPEDEIFSTFKGQSIIQLERKGNSITMRAGNRGEPLQIIGSHEMTNFKDEVLAGLFISSHNPEVVEEARVWNVRIDQP